MLKMVKNSFKISISSPLYLSIGRILRVGVKANIIYYRYIN